MWYAITDIELFGYWIKELVAPSSHSNECRIGTFQLRNDNIFGLDVLLLLSAKWNDCFLDIAYIGLLANLKCMVHGIYFLQFTRWLNYITLRLAGKRRNKSNYHGGICADPLGGLFFCQYLIDVVWIHNAGNGIYLKTNVFGANIEPPSPTLPACSLSFSCMVLR